MGFSISGSTAIIAIAILISAGTIVTAVSTTYDQVSDARVDQDAKELAQKNTDFEITNTSYDSTNDTLTVRANNTGTETLKISELSFLVDNTLLQPDNSSVDGRNTTDLWQPGEQLEVEFVDLSVDVDFQDSPSRVKIVTDTGVSRATSV